MNLIDIFDINDYNIQPLNIKKNLLIVYPIGGLGNFYCSRFLPNYEFRESKETNPYITYSKTIYNRDIYHFWDDQVILPFHLSNDFCQFEKQLKNFLLDGIKYHKSDSVLCHVPPILTSSLYNISFKKTIFIEIQKNKMDVAKLKISGLRNRVNDGNYLTRINNFNSDSGNTYSAKHFFKSEINYENIFSDVFEFSELYDSSKRMIEKKSDTIENINFIDILNEKTEHTNNLNNMIDNILTMIGE